MKYHTVPLALIKEQIPAFSVSTTELVFGSADKLFTRRDILTAAEIGYNYGYDQHSAKVRAYEEVLRSIGAQPTPKPPFRFFTWLRTFFS